ncbi:hypothetical protein Deipr_2296 (plasmid) [Deinococcus proteolyticus MRP]|uniref:Uncharacterized protein n=1 Tax=Deinococcus proteolyticus (strain ATCC 35074 / DSM 20540 / JCM 6276 / NBRC 101906 / NCIMB 13154 / VKM Ac-1939 / CCM 2703 / MRP) TaxID=693977 RepID=F0RQ62_DEIPM|nr:hypothetical protein [Deinococcus proteolyticus]ADY27421.1 hypothetical protein Deipr_2296 [Deinococcus proteolyticus MRP]
MNYIVYVPATRELCFQGMREPRSLAFPEQYREVTRIQAPDLRRTFALLQHGRPGCLMPEGEASFSVGGVLVEEGGLQGPVTLRCLDAGWEVLTRGEA